MCKPAVEIDHTWYNIHNVTSNYYWYVLRLQNIYKNEELIPDEKVNRKMINNKEKEVIIMNGLSDDAYSGIWLLDSFGKASLRWKLKGGKKSYIRKLTEK